MNTKLTKAQCDDISNAMLWDYGANVEGEDVVKVLAQVLGAKYQLVEVPLQEGVFTVDIACKDYNLLERMHKQESWTVDQQRHYEAGWEAALNFLLRDRQ